MKAVLLRAGSVPVPSQAVCSSPKVSSISRQSSFGGVCSGERAGGSSPCSPIISLHFRTDKRKPKESHSHIRRTASDTDIMRSDSRIPGGSRCSPAGIPEEEYLSDAEVDSEFRTLVKGKGSDRVSFPPIWPEFGISMEEIGFSGDGFGNGGKSGGDHGDDSFGDKNKIGDYYREMLKLNPGDSLLLRNYGKFLHEVERDTERAEEYYGRAILANPGDGEVLSLYGKLIWEKHRDESRAKSYFDRAVNASPDDW
ncbi:Tetratricopeptide-like helical [Corchorus olitorius]|uniref:Tetratricopeptide-like helical n=1 Tax=Corchorus olitorius TaxID=93759 RepID=A0A1R3JEP8_9ROSI|nr:Tetratricopeptide-like helical [Corchorus olitorius]